MLITLKSNLFKDGQLTKLNQAATETSQSTQVYKTKQDVSTLY